MDYSPLVKMLKFNVFVYMSEKLTQIELYIIAEVRKIREARGISQMELSLKLGKGVGFIGDIEAPSKKAKYNVKHLNEIAKIFNCSPKDFWPDNGI